MERIRGSDLIIKRVYEELNRFNWSEKEFIAYEQEIKRIRDEQAVLAQKLDDARDKGREEGIQIGQERGIQIGHEKGRAEGTQIGAESGRKAEKIEVAKAMLAGNMDINTISKLTGLPISEIEKLKKESIF